MITRVSVNRNRAERTTFRNGHAFLGYYHKQPDVRHVFDGQKLVCWLRPGYYVETALVAVVLGPVFTTAIVLGVINPDRWFIWLLVVLTNGLGWLMLVEATRTRSRIEFDFVKNKMSLFIRSRGNPFYSLDLCRVIQVITESFYRARTARLNDRLDSPDDWPGAVVYCHELAVRTDDDLTLTLLETTDESVIQKIKQILDDQLGTHVGGNKVSRK